MGTRAEVHYDKGLGRCIAQLYSILVWTNKCCGRGGECGDGGACGAADGRHNLSMI